ncbi:hypothetical protein HBH56_063460 [Parastagonospora nodorum]|uniref:Uncharacterized protein n=2 Tax=Phaeosphaeria nodorum (strain SN15 / ATCC MYA-4574 / FGSC 10173) TaxID=321614 RepID=A0A7U2HXC3_PHANO|nr:hypothetical protein HBH56_063460 [Parastagonospora nodorum]QRC92146.1 hypothetical protein JI435_427700 [Parastagonospora nodorum SN15]KAH3930627.1 hypothetical protein HBH54_107400 [Parastagonospora nodorum]KAH3954056.1 hypothetical protein HBH53_022490 [Parastagonospora nodorum]KAH4000261.1 hypothetical protein HBI10_105240 [Parastagonospora nodorum]
MSAMKRKAIHGGNVPDVMSQPLQKFKSGDGTQAVSLSYDPTGWIENHQMEDMDNSKPDAQMKLQRNPRKLPAVSRRVKDGIANEQVSFIIITRDNAQPDPYCQVSSTHGPLSWPAVADAYNRKFRIGQNPIGSAAMEKRARQHREAWMMARPDYPQNIVYAKKTTVAKSERHREVKPERVPHVTNPFPKEVRSTNEARSKALDPIREQDMYAFSKNKVSAAEPSRDEHTTIEVCDFYETIVDVLHVRTRDIVKTSVLAAEERKSATGIGVTLQSPSVKAVERYVSCISPKQLITLPVFDLKRGRQRDTTIGPRIVWDFTAFADLYNVASVMQDSHVRNLVLNQWASMQKWDIQLEIDAQALNSLFDSTEPDDPARAFWATAIYFAGAAHEILEKNEYHLSLLGMLKELSAL